MSDHSASDDATEWQSVGHLLEAAAARQPDDVLFISGVERSALGDERATFGDVNRRVNKLANALRGLGIAKGERVAVMLPNGVDFPVAWLAIAKLGAVMVPTNTGYQEHDLRYILTDSGASCILIHADYAPRLRQIRADLPDLRHVVVLGEAEGDENALQALTQDAADSFTITDVKPSDLLNIQYTSGTTGFPKGCMLTHDYWLLLGSTAARFMHLRPGDVDLTAQPFYYMDPQWNTAACLIAGIPLVIMERFSASRFWSTVIQHDVTILYLLGTMPFFLLKQPENPALEHGHRLRMIACSGIAPDFHAEFERRWNVPWREAFGMTETGVDLFVPLEDSASVGSGAMGKPVPTKEARAVDGAGNDVPDGQIGELVVRGKPMMLGYWHKPEQTAATIRDDGWLHTGDLVTRDERGYYHLVGRLKDMVRRSGENIAAAEVESVLIEYPAVQAAAVVPVPDDLRGEEVKAYLILKDGHTSQTDPPAAIIGYAASKLAKFKLPRYVEYVDSLPLTPSERVAKPVLISAKQDLRMGSYDMVDGVWR